MASDEYWQRAQIRLTDPVLGALASVPMSPAALMAYGPLLAVTDVLRLLILGLRAEAQAVLEFLPRLETAIADSSTLAALSPYQRLEAAASLRDTLSVGTWLATDSVRPQLAQDAFDHLLALNRHWGGRPTPPNLHTLMLLSVEAGAPDRALSLYRQHDARPISAPQDLRFSGNPRAVLVACLQSDAIPLAEAALARFSRRATAWHRDLQPVPYVGIVCLARTLRACHSALGRASTLSVLLPMLR